MRRIVLTALACALLSTGCPRPIAVIPDNHFPHRVAEESSAVVWLRGDAGQLVKTTVRVLPGWYLASPEIVEGDGKP